MIKRTHMAVVLSLPAVLGLGMLSGCAGKDKEAPQDQKQSNADGLSKETGGNSGSTSAVPSGAPGNDGKK